MPLLCGTDFSENARHAVRAAAAFAHALQEPLVLAHVVEEGAAIGAGQIVEAWSRTAGEQLEEIARPLRSAGVPVETRVLRGTPDEKLAELAAALQASLLVVGFLGRRSAERWRAGSLPARLARGAAVPVLVVRDGSVFEASSRGERPLRVLLAADFSVASDAAVAWLAALGRLGPCEISLLHSYNPVREGPRLGVPGRPPSEDSPEIETHLLRDLRARVAGLLTDDSVSVRAIPSLDLTAETIARIAEHEAHDLVVVGGHGRQGYARIPHDSVSERLLALAPASVVRVPVRGASPGTRHVPRISRVLAPTDLSELGNEAVLYAYALASSGGTVHLLHVVEKTALPNPLYAHYSPGRRATPEERAALERGLEVVLRTLVPKDAARRGIETRIHVVHDGSPADAIRATALREAVDVLCMGTHGRSGLSRLIGGSVAREIAAESPRPLFLVHPAATDGSAPPD